MKYTSIKHTSGNIEGIETHKAFSKSSAIRVTAGVGKILLLEPIRNQFFYDVT